MVNQCLKLKQKKRKMNLTEELKLVDFMDIETLRTNCRRNLIALNTANNTIKILKEDIFKLESKYIEENGNK